MTISLWCVLIAGLLPLIATGMAKFGAQDPEEQAAAKRYDNRAPRAYLDGLVGRRQRAHWAQLNSFEAFPLFAAVVVVAHLMQASPAVVDTLAMLFIAFRLSYIWAYIWDHPRVRSLVWAAAMLCNIGLFVASA